MLSDFWKWLITKNSNDSILPFWLQYPYDTENTHIGGTGILVYNIVPVGLSRVITKQTHSGAGFISKADGLKMLRLLRTGKVTVTFNSAQGVSASPSGI